MEFNLNDPAFGPMGSLSLSFSQTVLEVQQMLNALGYGPIKVDGLYGPETTEALAQFYNRLGRSAPGAVTQDVWMDVRNALPKSWEAIKPGGALAPKTGSSTSTGETPKEPIIKAFPWVTPAVLAGGVVVLSVVGYLWWRSSQGGGLFGAPVDDEDEDIEEARERRHGRKTRASKPSQCSRTPLVDFDEGKMVEAE